MSGNLFCCQKMKVWDNSKVSLFSKLSRNGVLKISLYYFTQNIQDTGIAGTQCECSISASVNWFKGRPPSFQRDLSTLFLQLSVMSLWCGLKSSLPFTVFNNLIHQLYLWTCVLWESAKCYFGLILTLTAAQNSKRTLLEHGLSHSFWVVFNAIIHFFLSVKTIFWKNTEKTLCWINYKLVYYLAYLGIYDIFI